MTNPNESLIERFYTALNSQDGESMVICYAPDVRFSDPVFPDLRGSRAGAMWRMLCEQGTDLHVQLLEREADGERGSARWHAQYRFSQTGRRVVNDVHASFRFEDGLIKQHTDSFDFYRWVRQALGPPGLVLGWTPLMRATVRHRAAAALAEFVTRSQ